MQFLTERQEIATAINIDKIPVITINIKNCIDGMKGSYEGDDVVFGGYRHYVAMFADENKDETEPILYKRIACREHGCGISSDFGYEDVIEMIHWQRAPHINPGDSVIIVFDRGDQCWLRKMTVDAYGVFKDVEN